MNYTHQAIVSDGAPPRPWCGGVGRSVMRKAEVDCPDCVQLDADRQARVAASEVPAAPTPGVSGPVGPHVVMPHIRAAREALDLVSDDGYMMGVFAERASAHALVAIAVLLQNLQSCPLEPLPLPNSAFDKGLPPKERHDDD